jgi:hypothetical protein
MSQNQNFYSFSENIFSFGHEFAKIEALIMLCVFWEYIAKNEVLPKPGLP